MRVKLLLPTDPTWNAEIDRIGALLDAQNNPTVFPYHFLQVVLPDLGGAMVEATDTHFDEASATAPRNHNYLVVGFILPRGIIGDASSPDSKDSPEALREYTFRYHPLKDHARVAVIINRIAEDIREQLGAGAVVPYSPHGEHGFTKTVVTHGNAVIGRPDDAEAAQINHLHKLIWNSPPEYVYPTDIHSDEFGLGTSLVARVDDDVAGFLFGFHRFGGPALPTQWTSRFGSELRLESQVMGVSPDYRGMRIGYLLKRSQAEEALERGISLIHWTADPLQYPNAALNFGLLRAVAFSFRPDYYPFRNDLNRVPASRFALTWLINSDRVRNIPLVGSSALIMDLQPEFFLVNDGHHQITLDIDEPYIAIEIPLNWAEMQQSDLPEAQRWREATDQIFAHYVGIEDGQYAITGVAVDDDKRYLIGQRADHTLWKHLAL